MPQRTVGRHRRARKPPVSATVLVGTALSASLITGVTIGTAAATASAQGAESARTAAVTRPLNPGADDDFGSGDEFMPGNAPAIEVVAGGAPNADAVRQKSRVLVTATTSAETTAAWVNPNPTAVVTSCFGERWGRLHAGVDLAAPDGTPIVAAGAGVVVRAGVAEGYGNAVLIDHGNGYLTHYGHLSKITVTVGQHVTAGQQIGNEGSTGHSTGPHLHFEVHQGFYQNPIEPTEWMHQHGVDIPGCVPLV